MTKYYYQEEIVSSSNLNDAVKLIRDEIDKFLKGIWKNPFFKDEFFCQIQGNTLTTNSEKLMSRIHSLGLTVEVYD